MPQLKSNIKVYVGIPWLRNDGYSKYLKSCIRHIEDQETGVEVLPPKVTQPYSGVFKKGTSSILYAIMDRMNNILDDFMKTGASHCFIVDADVEVPPNTVDALLRHDVDLASGVYPFHNFLKRFDGDKPCRAMMFGRVPEVMNNRPNVCGFFIPRDWEYMRGRVFGEEEMVSGGTGCILIKRRVLKRYHPDISPLRFTKKEGECGADVYFWKRAQVLGFTARVDANIVCGHSPEYRLKDVERWSNYEL